MLNGDIVLVTYWYWVRSYDDSVKVDKSHTTLQDTYGFPCTEIYSSPNSYGVTGKAHRTLRQFSSKKSQVGKQGNRQQKKEIYASIIKTDMQSVGVLVPL